MSDRTSGIDTTFESEDLSDTRLPEAIARDSAYRTPMPTSELLDGDVRNVQASSVTMERSGAESIVADRVSISNSGTRSIEAKSAQVDRSGVLSLRGQSVVLQESSAVSITADEVRMVNGTALFVRAGRVDFEDGARAIVMDGEGTRPVVTVQGAAAFGAALGFVLLVLGRMFGRRG